MRKSLSHLIAALVVAALSLGAGMAAAQVIDRIMAIVGRQLITLSDVRAALTFGLVEVDTEDPITGAVHQLIDRELILAEADRYLPPEPDPDAIERDLERVRARFESEDDFRRAAAESGVPDARLREIVVQNVRIQVYLEQRFTAAAQPADEEIARYFREHEAEFATDGRQPSVTDVREEIRARLAAERRRLLIDDWLASLRRRGDVVNLYASEGR